MKSISEFVANGISSVSDLYDALQLAMQLEFSTIPPYLCAQWSIDTSPGQDPSGVARTIRNIVVQEMYHFALAGNILMAIGRAPAIANPNFIPVYPTKTLPGGIPQALAVDLRPLSKAPPGASQLDVFLQIEKPEFPPVALIEIDPPDTIGAFYTLIADAFDTVEHITFTPNSNFINFGEATAIQNASDAKKAINRIKQEGEGISGNPDEPQGVGLDFAHYYKFKEILEGAKLKLTDGMWKFDGAKVEYPKHIYDFAASNPDPNSSLAFNRILTELLRLLQACWTNGTPFGTDDTDIMDNLQTAGTQLIMAGARPEFVWAEPA